MDGMEKRAWNEGMTPEEEKKHIRYMKEAMKQAKKAYALGEVPIGCVIVHEGRIIGRGYNRRNTDKNTLSHAEITAIRKASRRLGDWRLEECVLYVTLEPCQMCSGAIVQARIPETVIGCMNPKAGCAGSLLNILEDPRFNHQVHVIRGVMEQECSDMLKQFSGLLYLQSAIAGVMSGRGLALLWLPSISGVEVWVLRNGCL